MRHIIASKNYIHVHVLSHNSVWSYLTSKFHNTSTCTCTLTIGVKNACILQVNKSGFN